MRDDTAPATNAQPNVESHTGTGHSADCVEVFKPYSGERHLECVEGCEFYEGACVIYPDPSAETEQHSVGCHLIEDLDTHNTFWRCATECPNSSRMLRSTSSSYWPWSHSHPAPQTFGGGRADSTNPEIVAELNPMAAQNGYQYSNESGLTSNVIHLPVPPPRYDLPTPALYFPEMLHPHAAVIQAVYDPERGTPVTVSIPEPPVMPSLWIHNEFTHSDNSPFAPPQYQHCDRSVEFAPVNIDGSSYAYPVGIASSGAPYDFMVQVMLTQSEVQVPVLRMTP